MGKKVLFLYFLSENAKQTQEMGRFMGTLENVSY